MVQCDNTNNDVGNGGDVQWSMVNGINCCSIFTSWYSVTMVLGTVVMTENPTPLAAAARFNEVRLDWDEDFT